MQCSVCGGTSFTRHAVLWPELVTAWQLAPAEVEYVDRQQAETCDACGANLRSIALATAIRSAVGSDLLLRDLASSAAGRGLELLEINEAGSLSPTLRQFGHHVFAAYPEVDMHAMPYADDAFDVVVHSDTLEHVEHPVRALAECRRVLKPGGALCFTIPIIVGRMTRSRDGLSPSHHGDPGSLAGDLLVRHEFGADAWTLVMEAGFGELALHAVAYPAAIALRATK